MTKYKVVFSKSAERDIHKLPAKVVADIIPEIVALGSDPRPSGCKKLKGYTGLWRIRVGDYLVIYSISDIILLVDVRNVGHRKDVYR